MRFSPFVVASAMFLGCFGAGPDPGPAASDEAIPLARLPVNYGPFHRWFGHAIYDDSSIDSSIYVAVESNSGCVDNCAPETSPALWAVARDGSETVVVEPTGPSMRLAHDEQAIYWVDARSCSVNRVAKVKGSKPTTVPVVGLPPNCGAYGLVVDEVSVVLVVAERPGTGGPMDQSDPCCDLNNGNVTPLANGALYRVDKGGGTASKLSASLFCGAFRQCLRVEGDSIYYFTQDGSGSRLQRLARSSKDGAGAKTLLNLPSDRYPTSVTVTGSNVIVASAVNRRPPGCLVTRVDKEGGAQTNMFVNDSAFCPDAVSDDTGVYLALFAYVQNDSGGGGFLAGTGIGKLPLDAVNSTPTLLPIARPDFAARRLVLRPANIVLIDPFVIVGVPKSLVP